MFTLWKPFYADSHSMFILLFSIAAGSQIFRFWGRKMWVRTLLGVAWFLLGFWKWLFLFYVLAVWVIYAEGKKKGMQPETLWTTTSWGMVRAGVPFISIAITVWLQPEGTPPWSNIPLWEIALLFLGSFFFSVGFGNTVWYQPFPHGDMRAYAPGFCPTCKVEYNRCSDHYCIKCGSNLVVASFIQPRNDDLQAGDDS